MSQAQLDTLEHEVEEARARLAGDLARLRAPSTLSDFKEDLWAEANETKDELVEKTKHAATQGVQRLMADLKDRAAANPAAALAIGAGIAWRIVQRPPIASLLVGLGLFGLLRTSPSDQGNGIGAQTAKLAGAAKERARDWTAQAAHAVSGLADQASATADRVSDRVLASTQETVQSLKETATTTAGEAVDRLGERAAEVAEKATQAVHDLVPDQDTRDNILLGAAALAVAAAVGIAYQRGAQEELR